MVYPTDKLPPARITADDDALIMYTSGSTSRSKGVIITHRALVHALVGWEGEAEVARMIIPSAFREAEAGSGQMGVMLTSPLFHMSGLAVQCLNSLNCGYKLVFIITWDVEHALQLIQDERIAKFTGIPSKSWDIVTCPSFDKYDLSTLAIISSGSVSIPPVHIRYIAQRLPNAAVATGWGMTETSGFGTGIGGVDFLEHPRSCGRICSRIVELKISDEHGNALPRGETGEVAIRGAVLSRGYWNQPAQTAEAFRDGWFHTGDIGYLDDDERLYMTGRKQDMIRRAGAVIGPVEIDAVIYYLEAVHEAMAFGATIGGKDLLLAAVSAKPGCALSEEDVKAVVTTHLTAAKAPDHVVISAQPLRKLASGKLDKQAIREAVIEEVRGKMGVL